MSEDNAKKQYETGCAFISKNEVDQGISWLRKSAEQKYENAIVKLACIYFEDASNKKEKIKKKKCYKKAYYFAKMMPNNNVCQQIIGEIYRDGIIFPKNLDISLDLFLKASEQNNTDSQRKLISFCIKDLKNYYQAWTYACKYNQTNHYESECNFYMKKEVENMNNNVGLRNHMKILGLSIN